MRLRPAAPLGQQGRAPTARDTSSGMESGRIECAIASIQRLIDCIVSIVVQLV
jgi:hypothetical protein